MGSGVLPAVHPVLPVVPTQCTGGCLLCCCGVLAAFRQGHGAAMGLLLGIGLGKQRGAWPGPGCLSLTAGERTLSLQCVGARWWVEEAACGATPSSLALHLGSEFLAEMSPVPKQGSAQLQAGGKSV